MEIKVFLDSDVIISALLTPNGVSANVLEQQNIKRIITHISHQELETVAQRMNIPDINLTYLIKTYCDEQILKVNIAEFSPYTFDQFDTHIIAGAVQSHVKFLISYNIKHFNGEKIKEDFDILVMSPGQFLQWLRLNKSF